MIRVLHFADVINDYDFIDNVVKFCDRSKFHVKCWQIKPKFRPGSRKMFKKALELSGILKDRNIDILHTHHFIPTVIGIIAARIAGTKHIVFGRHYSNELYHIKNPLKRFAYFQLEKLMHRFVDAIVVPSKMVYEILEKQGAPMDKVHMIHYGFDFSRFKVSDKQVEGVRKELGLDGQFVISTIARLVPQKGHRYLFEAIKVLSKSRPEILWLVIGDGPEMASLCRDSRWDGFGKHVRCIGYRDDVLALIAASDIVVQPSMQDSFCQVIVEAMAMLTPIIMTRIGAAEELIESGRTGVIISQGNRVEMASVIATLYDCPDYRRKISNAGYASIRKLVDIRDIVKKTEELYV
ncbi:hypothetical protein LCGC14_0679940, partial [marine sediment metagenome]